MLLNSGNDAAYDIAANAPGGIAGFVDAMNAEVSRLGLTDTHFQNPAGFDDASHYSSAYDLAVIAQKVIADPTLARVVSTKETVISEVGGVSSDSARKHYLHNVNQLLGEDGIIGVKTGFTEKAGENLVGLVERNGRRVLTVVLRSTDRFGETKTLMDWIYKNYTWTQE